MITMEDRSDLVHFEHDGVKYAMTEQEIEAAYRYQEHQYRLRDAKRHLNILVFGYDDESDFNGPEHQEEKDRFFWEYGIKYEDTPFSRMTAPSLRLWSSLRTTRTCRRRSWPMSWPMWPLGRSMGMTRCGRTPLMPSTPSIVVLATRCLRS